MKTEYFTGKKFGRLEILSLIYKEGSKTIAVCKCDCGRERRAELTNLRNNRVKSCGCLARDNRQKLKDKFHTELLSNRKNKKNTEWDQ